MRAETLARLHLAAAVLVALLAAGTATAAGDAAGGLREIRIGARAGEPGRFVICAEPRVAAGSALMSALRRGLFDVCQAYRAGSVSADEYRATLEAYPALVLQTVALEALQQPELAVASQRQAAALRQQLAANPALRVLCRIGAVVDSLDRATPSDSPQLPVCTFHQYTKE